ncbi:MAG: hypothetical protein J7M34_06420 [Anaerolineae bacterium]|nr:hypothetical protein [Anaerolineae bacterium]
MRQRRSLRQSLIWVLVLSLLVTFSTAGGALAAPPAAPLAQGEEPAFRLELPRIVVTVDEDGYPSVFGLSVKDIQNMTGMDMSMARVPANIMQMAAQAKIQHFEVAINDKGLFLFANGKPLPYIAWDQESLKDLVDALQAFQVQNAALIGRFVPFLPYIGISLAVQFPLPEGETAVPMRDPKDLSLVDIKTARGEVTGGPSVIFHAVVDVDEEGVPSIMGVSVRQIEQETGMNLSSARVPTNLMAQLSAGGIQHVQLKTWPDGLYLYLNGKPLPRLVWDSAHLATLSKILPGLLAGQPWAPLAGKVAGGLQTADVQVTVRFPVPSGAKELPLHDFSAEQ